MNYDTLLSDIKRFPAIADDTRQVSPGCLFVAGGGRDKAVSYARLAIELGAAVVVGPDAVLADSGIPYISVPAGRLYFAELANAYFETPSLGLTMIGVTGTCGKTTTTYLVESILREGGYSVGVIGTESYRYPGTVLPSTNTTPGAIALNRLLRQMKDAGCDAVAMEVSSHAIRQERARGLVFDGAIFTNLSTEHQDLHPDMEDYFATKARLFTEYADVAASAGKTFHACVNLNDEHGRRLAGALQSRQRPGYHLRVVDKLFGEGAPPADTDLRISQAGLEGRVFGVDISSPLIGRFNAENIAVAVGLTQSLGVTADAIHRGVAAVAAVPGRLERVPTDERSIFVDFAHKPGALAAVLGAVRPLTENGLCVVFGCGGRRDRAKRPEMGQIAVTLADRIVITSDNSRGEPWDEILNDILQGIPMGDRHKVSVIPDRREAIESAVQGAATHDIIVIAGRGSENELSVLSPSGEERRIHFNDAEVALETVRRLASREEHASR
jgi:UDP-N-acetylmuramoyl-L-alanyl-D-glutamate--2,6-diaminopimelate ligase